MDQQPAATERIGKYIAERYPMYVTNPGFEQWLYARAGTDREMIDRYLQLLDDYGYISANGQLSDDYQSLPDPAHIREDVERRLSALEPETRTLLAMASVEGDRFSTGILAALRGGSDGIDRMLEGAVRAGAIAPETNRAATPGLEHRYRFVPLEARTMLYEGLPDDERLRLHTKLVEHLSAEVEKVSDPGQQDMLHRMISEHNKAFARPDSPA